MKVAIGMLTFDVFRTGRLEMMHRTWKSIQSPTSQYGSPYLRDVFTNGNTDPQVDELVRSMGGVIDNADSRVFHGMRLVMDAGVRVGADIIVFTADDIEYRPGWLARLVRVWEAAPPEVAIISPLLEPMYSWNQITDAVDIAGERALVRDSVGGCAWSFRASDREFLDPPAMMPGEDLAVCKRVLAAGRQMLQLDLADHIGEQHSAWGNESYLFAQPVDREKWGLPDGA